MKQLTLKQRYEIETLLKQKYLRSEIALAIGKDKSVITRELVRNGRIRVYHAQEAHQRALDRKRRNPYKLTAAIKKQVDEKLELKWSPEQISQRLHKEGKEMVSHECIYRYVYDNRKEGGSLYQHLRWHRKKRRRRLNRKDRRGIIPNKIMIDQRPEIVNERKRYGDWEADTIIGAQHQKAILTLVERKSKYTLAIKLPDRDKKTLRKKMISIFKQSPLPVKTITSDNGKEFADHLTIAAQLKTEFYFAQPGQAWQRGLNENTNGLLRQFIPKKTNFDFIEDTHIKLYINLLNNRPRKSLNFLTPTEIVLRDFVAFDY